MKTLKLIIPICLALFSQFAVAQGPGGGGGNFDPSTRVEKEKEKVLETITTLTDDQKTVINSIYDDYLKSVKESFENRTGDRDKMREKMTSIKIEKDDAMKDALDEEQYKQYTTLMEEMQPQRRGGSKKN